MWVSSKGRACSRASIVKDQVEATGPAVEGPEPLSVLIYWLIKQITQAVLESREGNQTPDFNGRSSEECVAILNLPQSFGIKKTQLLLKACLASRQPNKHVIYTHIIFIFLQLIKELVHVC